MRRDIDIVFSRKGIACPKTIEDFKSLGFFSPTLKYKDREIYLSSEGIIAVRRISSFVHETEKYSGLVDYNDVFQSILEDVEPWLADALVPDEQDFLASLDERLNAKIETFTYFCRVDGLELKDIDEIRIGKKSVRAYSSKILEGVDFHSDDIKDVIKKEYNEVFIIFGEECGSSSVAHSRFYYHSEICLSLLRLYSCAIYKSAIRKVKLRLINNCSAAFGPASTVGWDNADKSGTFTRCFRSEQDLELDTELLHYLSESCFFDESGDLIEKQERSELEESIVKAIYWFGEAQKDRFDASSWIKLWTCLECFFSLDRSNITEANARGIASLLLFGGYNINDFGDYHSLKAKISSFYDTRSNIIHNADYTHIEQTDLDELAYMVAWVIITIVSLLPQGYSTRKQIKEQANRLDNLTKSSERKKLRRRFWLCLKGKICEMN